MLAWPKPSSGDDGPPYSYAGAGAGGGPSAGTVPPTGTARILVVVCNPTDLVPPDAADTRQDVVDTFADVTTFYDQASYGQLDVQVDVTTLVALLNDADYYHRTNGSAGYPNIDAAVLNQLMAERAQGAVNQGFDLNNYSVMVASVFMPGFGVRAWGGWSQNNFAYDDGDGVSINITTTNPLGLIAQRHDADWARRARVRPQPRGRRASARGRCVCQRLDRPSRGYSAELRDDGEPRFPPAVLRLFHAPTRLV